MINYEYTEVSRLDKPHKYMYTSYKGSEFLYSYFRDRLKCLKIFEKIKGKKYKNKVHLSIHLRATIVLKDFLDRESYNESMKSIIDWNSGLELYDSQIYNIDDDIITLSSFNVGSEINSEKLLISTLNSQLDEENENLIKFWLDLLVQRFEVTKKLYENYPANFSKGEGKNNIIQIYWMFALSLTLFYCSTKSIKYLSALLKVSDLLCSLDEKFLNQNIPPHGLSLIILVELLSIKLLSKTIKGVDFELA